MMWLSRMLLLFMLLCLMLPNAAVAAGSSKVKVHFIDVGQADSILIQSEHKNLLIDTGDENSGEQIVNYLQANDVDVLDALVITHPHHDHIGGVTDVLEQIKVQSFYMPPLKNKTKTFNRLKQVIDEKKIMVFQAKAGDKINIEKGVTMKIIAPLKGKYDKMNDYSYVMKLIHGKNDFLFMADAGEQSETQLLTKNVDIRADVIKVGHHGANTGTTLPFLKAVNPDYAVISVGRNNRYGFPTKAVIKRLKYLKIPTYRTDLMGTIVAVSDGQSIEIDNEGIHDQD